MDYKKIIVDLKNIIEKNLVPLISRNYWLLDLPYFPNVGDVLIWQGTLDLLKKHNFKCSYSASQDTFNPPHIHPADVILIMGGGNFGDLWNEHRLFRLKIIELYPNNRIIQLPQSLFYKDKTLLEHDSEIFNKHKDIHLMFRDKNSYDIANHYFINTKNSLIPDMAFCLDMSKYENYLNNKHGGKLFIKRSDQEFNSNINYSIVPSDVSIRDWSSMEDGYHNLDIIYKLQRKSLRFDRIFHTNTLAIITDILYKNYVKKMLIREGVCFISSYDQIYTTRLHVAILSVLIGKKCILFDNSYKKNSGLYESFLQNCDNIQLIRNNE